MSEAHYAIINQNNNYYCNRRFLRGYTWRTNKVKLFKALTTAQHKCRKLNNSGRVCRVVQIIKLEEALCNKVENKK